MASGVFLSLPFLILVSKFIVHIDLILVFFAADRRVVITEERQVWQQMLGRRIRIDHFFFSFDVQSLGLELLGIKDVRSISFVILIHLVHRILVFIIYIHTFLNYF